MRFEPDERGVTVQVGTVLLFAILVVLLSTYQATVVPQQNQTVEFNHNERVHGQLQDLRDELLRSATTGSGGSAPIALGTNFPTRALFVNPPPPAGTIATRAPANVTVENASALGETGDYWTGDDRNFSSRHLVYVPDYRQYQQAPTTVYENTVLYDRFDSADVTVAGQRVVDGNRISLVALNGSLGRSSSETATVDVRAVSAATRTVTVSNASADQNVSVLLPSDLGVSTWEELLAEEMDQPGNDDRYVLDVQSARGGDAVRLVLEPGTYELELAKLGVGEDVSDVETHYVTDREGDDASVAEGSSQRLVVEVRDRYNNPVSGATLNATLTGGLSGDTIASQGSTSGGTLTGLTTDGDGQVTIQYDAPTFDGANEDVTVQVSVNGTPGGSFAPGTRTNLSFNLTAVNTDGSGLGGGGGGGAGGGAYDVNWTDASASSGLTCDAELTECTLDTSQATSVDLTANVTADGDLLSGANVDYALNNSTLGTLAPGEGVTDANGQRSTTLQNVPNTNASVSVYAESGGDADNLTVRLVGNTGGPSGPDVAYVERSSGQLRGIDRQGDVTKFDAGGNVVTVGPATADLDGDGATEVAYLTSSGHVELIDTQNRTQTLVSAVSAKKTAIAVGSWKGSPTSVFFANNDDQDGVYRKTVGASRQRVATFQQSLRGVLGIGDVDGDGNDELMAVTEGGKLAMLDDDGQTYVTDVEPASSSGLAVGAVANYDGSGRERVAIVDGSNNPVLVGCGFNPGGKLKCNGRWGGTTTLSTARSAKKAPLGAADLVGGSTPEIVYAENVNSPAELTAAEIDGGGVASQSYVTTAAGGRIAVVVSKGVGSTTMLAPPPREYR